MKTHDWNALAKAIKENAWEGYPDGIYKHDFLKSLCAILKAENPGFDENKFRELVK